MRRERKIAFPSDGDARLSFPTGSPSRCTAVVRRTRTAPVVTLRLGVPALDLCLELGGARLGTGCALPRGDLGYDGVTARSDGARRQLLRGDLLCLHHRHCIIISRRLNSCHRRRLVVLVFVSEGGDLRRAPNHPWAPEGGTSAVATP